MNQREQIYLAALLHDIGKFYQRADQNSVAKSKHLKPRIKELENAISPSFNGKYSHKHVLWTAQFFDDFQTHFKNLLGIDEALSDRLLRMSASHHAPSDFYEKIIQKADHYSSGADRTKENSLAWKDAEEEADKNWDSFKRIKMNSVFESISLSSDSWENPKYSHKLPLMAIGLSQDYFPKLSAEDLPDYEAIWTDFIEEFQFIQTRSTKAFLASLLFLLEKYTTRIPSSTQHLPDVSLYDHLKTTAAFALCLFDYVNDKELKEIPRTDKKPFLLVGGDISGIQKFIYGIIARNASKNLKGRSFYLQLLSDTIVRMILDELELFDGNVVYASGGTFYLLAPNTDSVKEKLQSIETKITDKLMQYHNTQLYLGVDCVAFGEDELFANEANETIGNSWRDLAEKLSQKKSRRFKTQLRENYSYFFEPKGVGGKEEKDAITGEELVKGEKTVNLEGRIVKAYTAGYIEMGKKLRDTHYIIQSKEKLTYFKEEGFDPIGLGYYYYFINYNPFQHAEYENQLKKSADSVRVIYFNRETFFEPIQKGIDNVYGFTFYGGNDYPRDYLGHPKTFEELAGVEFEDAEKETRKSAPGLVRLGVLRMDVDNLGTIFQRGLPTHMRTFSRFCTLSRSLDYFFKGYLNLIWQKNEAYQNFTQIIYSGGDDLFIVGKWDLLPAMAQDIRDKFNEWTCKNPNLTLSGGMAIVPPKFPLLKAAEMAESFEKAAKNHKTGKVSKNAFSLFDFTYNVDDKLQEIPFSFNWDKEYEYLLSLKKELFEAGLNEAGFASDMLNLVNQAKFYKSDDRFKIKNYEVVWMAAYKFKRMIDSDKKNENRKRFLLNWSKNIATGKISGSDLLNESCYHPLQLIAIASRWLSLEKRS